MDYNTIDMDLWNKYKKNPKSHQAPLLKHFDPLIQKQVNKWSGNIPRKVLENKAKMLTIGAFNTYKPTEKAKLSTHVVNSMQPISRVVYTHSNVARVPENIVLKIQNYKNAKEHLTTKYGRDPSTDELHGELGWTMGEINKMEIYLRNDLVESEGNLNDSFFGGQGDKDADTLNALYYDLDPKEKLLFEHTSGYNGKKIMTNPQLQKLLGINQAKLSYQKTLLNRKIKRFM